MPCPSVSSKNNFGSSSNVFGLDQNFFDMRKKEHSLLKSQFWPQLKPFFLSIEGQGNSML